MLVSMKQMLRDARRDHYAVPAFDVSNYEMMRCVLETCEEERSPAILMGLSVDLADRGMELLHGMAKAASDCFDIPVCMHFDHATDIEWIKRACDLGFSSVMFDGSVLPFEENAEKTAQVTEYAHARGISVEAELGHVGNGNIGGLGETGVDTDPGESLTVASEVAKFVELTDVDALAVAIGTAHGVYKKTPSLRIDRLKEIAAVCHRPLVLHGGSGTPVEQVQEAIRHGGEELRPVGRYFVFTGNTTYGVQNLEYDANTHAYYMAVYPGGKPEYGNFPLFAVDAGTPPLFTRLQGLERSGNLLALTPAAQTDAQGVSGWHFPWGSTGLFSAGDGSWYICHEGSDDQGQYGNIHRYVWNGQTPFVPVE